MLSPTDNFTGHSPACTKAMVMDSRGIGGRSSSFKDTWQLSQNMVVLQVLWPWDSQSVRICLRVAGVWHKPQVGSFWGCRNYNIGGSDYKADSGSL